MSYMETFDETSFQKKVLHPNTGEIKLVTFYHTVWRATESHQINKICSFLILVFNQYAPHQICLLVLATILTHRNL